MSYSVSMSVKIGHRLTAIVSVLGHFARMQYRYLYELSVVMSLRAFSDDSSYNHLPRVCLMLIQTCITLVTFWQLLCIVADVNIVWYDRQVKQENPEEKAILHIPSSVRGDTGKYTITAKNEFGEDSGDFNVIVLGKLISRMKRITSLGRWRYLVPWRCLFDRTVGYRTVAGFIVNSSIRIFRCFLQYQHN